MQSEEFALDPAGAGCVGEKTAASFEALFREHYPRVVSLLTRLTGDRGRAEEAAADVFHRFAGRPALVRSGEDSLPWLYRSAMNAGIDILRAGSRRKRHEEAAGAEIRRSAPAPDALDELLRAESRAGVRASLARMKPRDAQLLLLRSSGLRYRQLAAALGVETSSIGTLLARAEAQFERVYREHQGEAK